MGQELLSLSTLVERESIKIESALHPEGRLYELRNVSELSALELQVVLSRQKQVDRLQKKDSTKLTAAETGQMIERLNELVCLVAPSIEPEVLDELADGQKAAIVETWGRMAEGGGAGKATAAQPTGDG
jgi:hypothetical protein